MYETDYIYHGKHGLCISSRTLWVGIIPDGLCEATLNKKIDIF